MTNPLHITSGDSAGGSLAAAGLPGEVFVWHDILYDGPRNTGWPTEATLQARAAFIERETGGGLGYDLVLDTFRRQYRKLEAEVDASPLVLWFDACLFDQSMLAHILMCLNHLGIRTADLLCIDAFAGIVPYNGLGQLSPAQLASCYDQRKSVTDEQYRYAGSVDQAFATQDLAALVSLAEAGDAPLPWVPAAAKRWLQEQPNPTTGLGRLETLALAAIRDGCDTPGAIFKAVAAADTKPQYWGDTMLWAKVNALADRSPPLVTIEGPAPRLPVWESALDLGAFNVTIH